MSTGRGEPRPTTRKQRRAKLQREKAPEKPTGKTTTPDEISALHPDAKRQNWIAVGGLVFAFLGVGIYFWKTVGGVFGLSVGSLMLLRGFFPGWFISDSPAGKRERVWVWVCGIAACVILAIAIPKAGTMYLEMRAVERAKEEAKIEALVLQTRYTPGALVAGIPWDQRYTELRLWYRNNSSLSMENINLDVTLAGNSIRAVAQASQIPGVSMVPRLGRSFPVALSGTDQDGNAVDVPIEPQSPTITPEYHISITHLPPGEVVSFLFVTLRLNQVVNGVFPDKAISGKNNPESISVKGSYEASPIDGGERFPIDWSRNFP